jgi:hypothetical protein
MYMIIVQEDFLKIKMKLCSEDIFSQSNAKLTCRKRAPQARGCGATGMVIN